MFIYNILHDFISIKVIDILFEIRYIVSRRENKRCERGVAQTGSARALGAWGRRFKSSHPDQISSWPLGQAVKTPPFHGGNRSSSLLGVTKYARPSVAQ